MTLASSYTPWGDILSVQGDGGFTYGYFGSMMDAATGLLYIGNGQYYDPATGRFINGGNQMNNLPVMVDPAGMFLAPLSLLPLMFSKKRKKRTKLELLLILLVVSASLGMSLTTLNNVTTSPSPSVVPVLPIENQSENPTVHLSDAALLGNPRSTDNPIDSPSIQCGDSIVYRADYTANDLINFANGTETEKTAEAEPGDIRYWKPKEMEQVLKHAWDVAYALQATLNRILYYYLGRSYVRVSAFEAWNLAFGGKVTFKRMGVLADTSGICVGENLIHMYDTKDTEDYDDDGKPIYSDSYVYFTKAGNRPRVIVHELGHNFRRVYFNRTGALNGGIDLYSKIPENFLRPWDYQWGGIFHQTTLLTGPVYKFGYTGSEKTADVAQFGHPNAIELRPAEEFADMFVGYVYGFDLTCIEYQEMNVYHKEGLNDKYGKAFNCNEGIEKAQFMQEEIGYILVKAYFGYKEK